MRTDWNTQAPEKKTGDRGRFLDALALQLEGTLMQSCLCWGPGGCLYPHAMQTMGWGLHPWLAVMAAPLARGSGTRLLLVEILE